MSKGISMTIEAPDVLRLEKTFHDLEYADKRKILISAFRKATRPVLNQIRANAPRGKTGNLRRSIGLLVARNEIAVILGARKSGGFKGWHGHLIEEGTVDRYYMSKHGKRHFTGKMNPTASYAGFFRRAISSTGNVALNMLGDEWHKAIENFHRKNGLR